MSIHQIQVRYEPVHDRLLLQMLTVDRQLLPIWLTRRLTSRLMPHLRRTVSAVAAAGASPNAMVLPDAQDMMAQASRERALKSADLKTPFDADQARQPLGPEPLLPVAIDVAAPGGVGVALTFRDSARQSVEVKLGQDHALVMVELIEAAIAQSEWELPAAGATAAAEPPRPDPMRLN